MQEHVYNNLPKLKNKSKVLGHQFLLNAEDERVGEEERLLSFATGITFEEVISTVWELGGIAIPAHIDRPSYSVISNLGMLPPNQFLTCLEVSQYCEYNDYVTKYKHYTMLQSSDSHELGFIGVCNKTLDIHLGENEKLSPENIINFLRKDKNW
jgi:PHP family Zn ribbon phosphoesterase